MHAVASSVYFGILTAHAKIVRGIGTPPYICNLILLEVLDTASY